MSRRSPPAALSRLQAELRSRRREHARFLAAHRTLEVEEAISPNDLMHVAGEEEHYFLVGASALHCIDVALLAAGRRPAALRRILDLPCGHGRVLRFLRAAFPEAELVACDLDRDGVDFCAKAFGATPVYSDIDPSRLALPGRFDLVWVGSLLTHLPKREFLGFLRLFESILAPAGILVVTLAGRFVAELIRAGDLAGIRRRGARRLLRGFDRRGFGFARYRRQGEQLYGRTVVKRHVLASALEAHPSLRLLTYLERGWDCRQDVVALVHEGGADAIESDAR